MATNESFPASTGENSGQPQPTTMFFNALSAISAQPGNTDLSWHVEHLASSPETANVFKPLQVFNTMNQKYGFDAAVDSINLHSPEGVPVGVVFGNDKSDNAICDGKVVAVTSPDTEEHGTFKCVAVADMGTGPVVAEVDLYTSEPGKVYFVSVIK